ncbi:MAG: hypothetical protein ACM34I_10965 [bacterium]
MTRVSITTIFIASLLFLMVSSLMCEIRNPEMTKFETRKISDADAREIAYYILKAFK